MYNVEKQEKKVYSTGCHISLTDRALRTGKWPSNWAVMVSVSSLYECEGESQFGKSYENGSRGIGCLSIDTFWSFTANGSKEVGL